MRLRSPNIYAFLRNLIREIMEVVVIMAASEGAYYTSLKLLIGGCRADFDKGLLLNIEQRLFVICMSQFTSSASTRSAKFLRFAQL
jgi:hypothetical protein